MDRFGAAAIALSSVLSVFFVVAYGVFIERAVMRFRSLSPQFCSIYNPYFWWHERLWKLLAHPVIFNGTPFKSVIWRLLGVRIGSRVFDDGCHIPERTLVAIGNGCTLNAGSEIQSHSQEDGTFKSDRVTIGAGCTIGVGALVHYGVTMGDGAVLATDSFLMKGEEIPPHARWGGNPAGEMRVDHRADNRGAALVGAKTPVSGGPVDRPGGRHRAVDTDIVPSRVVAAGAQKGRPDLRDRRVQPAGRHRQLPSSDNRRVVMVGAE